MHPKSKFIDIKALINREALLAKSSYLRRQPIFQESMLVPEENLEDHANKIINSIYTQWLRASENNESVIHIIPLLRIKPSTREYFKNMFNQKLIQTTLSPKKYVSINDWTDTI